MPANSNDINDINETNTNDTIDTIDTIGNGAQGAARQGADQRDHQHVNQHHGGDLQRAASDYGIALEHWLDLSTGIAPWGWPVGAIPDAVWQRLPQVNCPLQAPAAAYYGCQRAAVLAVPGSQYVIQTLPALFAGLTVALPDRGYFEHRRAWTEAGHRVLDYGHDQLPSLDRLIRQGRVDAVLVINPNNPTTVCVERELLLQWREILAQRGGVLIVDEAFMDLPEGNSLAADCPLPALVVLRSVGKFFGLAGLRLGFALSDAMVQTQLQQRLGPWAVSGPAQYIGCQALLDRNWQRQQRQRIAQMTALQLQAMTRALQAQLDSGQWRLLPGPLFISLLLPSACGAALFEALAARAILIRRFDYGAEACLRFALPASEQQCRQLQSSLVDALNESA
jgi:cobalamin biosynthetic protein CobC